MSINQRFGYVFGAVYLAVGLLGFAVTGGVGFASSEGALLLGIFELNPLHNLVHLAVGAGFLGSAAAGVRVSQAVNAAIGAVYLVVGLLGIALVSQPALNILAINVADNVLHLASGALALGIGLYGATRTEAYAR